MKDIAKVAREVAETMTHVVPDGYVLVFLLLPQKLEKGKEFVTCSVPTIEGGSEAIHELLQEVLDVAGKEVREETFSRPIKQ